MKKLAIVGSVIFPPEKVIEARDIIIEELTTYAPDLCVSGGAIGIDTFYRKIAAEYGYDKLISLYPDDWGRAEDITSPAFIQFLPRKDILSFTAGKERWDARGGYRARNVKVATTCTRLVAIRSSASKTYGSGWTHDYAKMIGGRETRMEVL